MKIYRKYDPNTTSTTSIPLVVFNAGLSCRALGVLCYLYSLPDYAPSLYALAERLNYKPQIVMNCLKELSMRGFIEVDLEGLKTNPEERFSMLLSLPKKHQHLMQCPPTPKTIALDKNTKNLLSLLQQWEKSHEGVYSSAELYQTLKISKSTFYKHLAILKSLKLINISEVIRNKKGHLTGRRIIKVRTAPTEINQKERLNNDC